MKITSRLFSIALAATASTQGLTNVSFAQMISPDGKTNTTVTTDASGTIHDVRTSTVQGNVAFNSFNNFDVYANNTANLHLPGGTANLINMVRGKRTNIDGILNSIKDGKIGGNVFFLNPHGIMIGESGVVNVGSLVLATPTPEFIENAIAADRTVSSAFTQAVLAGDMPINPSGLISVKGKINTRNGAALKAGKVEIAKTGEVSSAVNTSDLVNVGKADAPVEIRGGKIVLKGETSVVHRGKIRSAGSVEIEGKKKVVIGKEKEETAVAAYSLMSAQLVDGGGTIELTGAGTTVRGISILSAGDVTYSGSAFTEAAVDGVVSVKAANNLYLTGDFTLGAFNYEFIANNILEVKANTTIKSASTTQGTGDLTFQGVQGIVFGDGVIINTQPSEGGIASGDISLVVRNVRDDSSYANANVSATINLGEGVQLIGKNVTLQAIAVNEVEIYDGNLSHFLGDYVSGLADEFEISGVVAEARAKAGIAIGKNVIIEAAEDLTINTNATVKNSLKMENAGTGIGVGLTNAESSISIESGSSLSGENVAITAESVNSLSLEVAAASGDDKGSGSGGGSGNEGEAETFNLSLAYAKMDGLTSVTIAEGAEIAGSKAVSIGALTNKTLKVKSTASVTEEDTKAAVSLLFAEDDINNNVVINGKVSAGTTLEVASKITSEETSISSKTTIGTKTIKEKVKDKLKGLKDGVLEKLLGKAVEKTNSEAGISSEGGGLGAAGAVAVVFHNNAATLTLGGKSQFVVDGADAGSAVFYSGMEDNKFSHSVSSTIKSTEEDQRSNSGSLAVLVMENNNTATVVAKDGATFDVDGELKFNSEYTQRHLLGELDRVKDSIDTALDGDYSEALAELQELWDQTGVLFNTQVKSAIKSDKEENTSEYGISGSVSILEYNNTARTELGAVNINQNLTFDNSTSVEVTASVEGFAINLGGNSTKSEEAGIGATYLQTQYGNTAVASIGDGSMIYAQDKFIVDAKNDLTSLNASYAYGSGSSYGLDGAFNWLDIENTTVASVGQSNVTIEGTDAGVYRISALDEAKALNVTGGVAMAKNVGVGAAVSITDIERNTEAYLGAGKDAASNALAGEFKTDKALTVNAENAGFLQAHSLSGAKVSESKNDKTSKNEGKEAEGGSGKYGVGISGNVSLTNISGGASAYVNGINYIGGEDLSLTAKDGTDITTVAGALIWVAQQETSAGIAGAVSINEISNTTEAFIRGADVTLTGGNLALSSSNTGDIFAIAAGGGLTKSSEDSGISVGIAGSVTTNTIGNSTGAYIEGSSEVKVDTGTISIKARDTAGISSIAGAISVNIGRKAAVGIGASVGVNTIENSVYAFGKNSTITGNGITIVAENDSDIFTVSGTVGVASGSKGLAAAAAVSVNEIDNKTLAYLDNSQVTVNAADLTITSSNESEMMAIAGQFTLALGGWAGGGSVAVNTIGNSTLSYIGNESNVEVKDGSLTLAASNASTIETSSAGVSVATGDVAVAGSVSVNNIDTIADANIDKSTVSIKGSASISAKSANEINFYGGMIAASSSVGAGGTVGVNNVSNNAAAYINNSTVDVYGGKALSGGYKGLLINSDVSDKVELWSFNVAGSGKVAVAANTNVSQITNSSSAYINKSEINQGTAETYDNDQKVAVTADNSIDISTYGGSVAGSGNAGVGASVDVTRVETGTRAYILDSTVYSKNDIEVSTTSTGEYSLVMATGGVAIKGAGVAGNVGVVNFAGINEAYAKGSTITTSGNLTIEALDYVSLGDADDDSKLIMGSAGIGVIGAGVGGTVWVSSIQNSTSAFISDSVVDATGKLTLNADGEYELSPVMVTVGVAAEGAGIGLSAGVNTVASSVQSYIEETAGKTTLIKAGNVAITASNNIAVRNSMAGGGIGVIGVGIGGAVNVNTIDTVARAGIGSGVELTAMGKLDISAYNEKTIEDTVISTGLGAVGVSGSVSIHNIGSNLDSESVEALTGKGGNDTSVLDELNKQLSQVAAIDKSTLGHGDLLDDSNTDMSRFSYDLSGLTSSSSRNQSTSAYIESGATVAAGGDINVKATDVVSFHIIAGGVAAGGVGAGATVAIVNIDTSTGAYIGSGAKVASTGGNINILSNSNIPQGDIIATIGAGAAAFSAGAVVATVNSTNDNYAYIADNAVVTAEGKALTVKAQSTADIEVETVGVSVGTAAVGASVAVINKDGVTQSYLGDKVEIKAKDATITSKTNIIVDVLAAAGAGGVISGNAVVATANVGDSLLAGIGENSKLTLAGNLNLVNHGSAEVSVSTVGASLGAALTVGGSVATGELLVDNQAVINEGASITAEDIIINANEEGTVSASSVGVAGGLASLSGSVATAKASGSVSAIVGNNVTITGKNSMGVTSQSDINLASTADRYSIGGVSGGMNKALSESGINTRTIAGQGMVITTPLLEFHARGAASLTSDAVSGSGGYLNVAAAFAESSNNSNTDIIVGSTAVGTNKISAGTLVVDARNDIALDSRVDGTQVGVITGSGFEAETQSTQNMQVVIGGDTQINSNHVKITALNQFAKDYYDQSIDYLGGGAVNVAVGRSTTTLSAATDIVFGDGLTLNVSKDADGASTFVVQSFNNFVIHDLVKLIGGGIIGSPVLHTTITTDSVANITVGKASLKSAGDIEFDVKTDLDLSAVANLSVYGVAAVVNGRSIINANADQNITLKNGSDVYGLGDVYFSFNKPRNAARAKLDIEAKTQIWNITAVPICTGSTADAVLNLNSYTDIQSGGKLRSAGDIHFDNLTGIVSSVGLFDYVSIAGAIAASNKTGSAKVNQYGKVNVDGQALAGVNSIQNIVIDQDGTVSVSDPESNVTWRVTGENMANNLLSEIDRLTELRREYAADPILKGAYELEIEFLQSYMELLGLGEWKMDDGGNKIFITKVVSDVQYITFDDINVSKGDIYVNANDLAGTGVLSAEGYAEVTITNNSDMLLRLNDIIIKDGSQGVLFYNSTVVSNAEGIEKLNSTVKNSGFDDSNIKTYNSSTQESKLIVRNTYASTEQGSSLGNILELKGDIQNSNGLVDIFSEGSIYTSGSVLGGQINISSNKDVIQSYYDGFYHVGGDPAKAWDSIASASEANKTNTSSNDAPSALNASSVIGQNVFISGRYLNLNGLIQAGVADLTLNIGSSFNVLDSSGKVISLAQAKANYDANTKAGQTNVSYLYSLEQTGNNNISAYYNVLTGEIEVGSISAGGGSVQLYGHIINTDTNGNGKIVALDGYSRLNITNDSNYTLVINSIDLSKAEGVIKITDTAKSITSNDNAERYLQTVYTRYFDESGNSHVKVVNNTQVDAGGNGTYVVSDTVGTTGSYNPLSGQRYVWTTGQERIDTDTYTHEDRSFWGMDFLVPDVTKYDHSVSYGTPTSLKEGELVLLGQTSNDAYIYNYKEYQLNKEVTENKVWESSTGWWIFSYKTYHHKYVTETGNKIYNTHSIKADNAVGVEFVGHSTGAASITSNSNIVIANTVKNASGSFDIVSSGGAILNSGNGYVSADNINLTANTGIGVGNQLAVNLNNDGVLSAQTQGGDINLYARYGDIQYSNIQTNNGNINLEANGSIMAAGSNAVIKGSDVSLTALTGSVGSAARVIDMQVDTVSARASGSVFLNQSTGDLGINSIVAGDYVEINVANGNVYDANTNEKADPRTAAELLDDWRDMELFGDAGWTEDQLKYAVSANKIGSNTSTTTEIEEANITADKVKVTASGAIGMDDGEITLDLTGYSTWTAEQKLLLASAEADALSFVMSDDGQGNSIPVSVTIQKIEDLDIHAKDITLNASGYIYLGGEVDININQIKAGDGENITIKGSQGIYNVSTSDTVANIQGGNVILEASDGGIGAENKAVSLDITGKLDARAREDIYLDSKKDLNLSYIYSAGQVNITTAHDIINVLSVDEINIRAHGISLEAANVGSSGKALVIQLDQDTDEDQDREIKVLDVNAHGDAYITAVNGINQTNKLYLGTVDAGGYLELISESDMLNGGTDSAITAETARLESIRGSLGSADEKLVTKAGELTAAARKDVNLYLGLTDNTTLGSVTASTGEINIEGKSVIDALSTLTAGTNIKLDADTIRLAGDVIAGKNIDITGNNLESGNIVAIDGDLRATLTDSITTRGTTKSGGNMKIQAGNEASFNGLVQSGASIAIDAAVLNINSTIEALKNIGLTVGDITSKTGTVVKTQEGSILIDAENTIGLDGDIESGNSVLISGDNVASTGSITASNKATITANQLVVNNISTKVGDIITTTTGDTFFNGQITSGNNIQVISDEDFAMYGVMTATNEITLDNRKIVLNGNVTARNDVRISASGDFVLNANLSSVNMGVQIKDSNNVLLNGVLSANKGLVDINTSGNMYDTFSDDKASITANDINLSGSNIGQSDNYLGVNTSMTSQGYLSAQAQFDLYITSPGKGLDLKTLEVTEGDINIAGNTSLNFFKLEGSEYNLKANNITLHAVGGQIGSADAYASTALNSTRGKTNLLARDGIYVRQTTPSFYSDYVHNTGNGVITLRVYDNNIQIKDIIGLKGSIISPFQYIAVNKDSQLTIGDQNIQKLVIDPVSSHYIILNKLQKETEEAEGSLKGKMLDYEEGNIFNGQKSL